MTTTEMVALHMQDAQEANMRLYAEFHKLADEAYTMGDKHMFHYWLDRADRTMWDNYLIVEDLNKVKRMRGET